MNETSFRDSEIGNQRRDSVLQLAGDFDLSSTHTNLRLSDGRGIRVPTALLAEHLQHPGVSLEASEHEILEHDDEEMVIPVVEEKLSVSKRTVETAKVRLHKSVQDYQETLDEPLVERTFEVERIVLNQVVEGAPPVRQEGDTTIYPIIEERLVLAKQLVLREEVRVTRRDTERRDTRVVTLRREHITVEREDLQRSAEA